MRIVTLSDFAAEQLQRTREARQTAYRDQIQRWESAASEHEASLAAANQAVRDAWLTLRPIALLSGVWRWMGIRLAPKPSMPQPAAPLEVEGRLAAGGQGEAHVLDLLARCFDDRWAAVRGYCNRAGETDILLIGPTGVAAIEVKSLNALVHVNGGSWTRDKFDRYGNVVERGRPIADTGGRSPAAQVNAVADVLQANLARRGHHLRVKRAVVLAHPASRLANVRNAEVDLVVVASDLRFADAVRVLVEGEPGAIELDPPTVERLVCEDHAIHLRRREQRGRAAHLSAQRPRNTDQAPRGYKAPTGGSGLKWPQPVSQPVSSEASVPAASELELRQADLLMADVQRLLIPDSEEGRLESKVRRAVAGHLASGGRTRVISFAIARSNDERARDLLRSFVRRCRYTLDLPDRTLTAIVTPVAVRWTTPTGADWSAVEIAAASRPHLNTPAIHVRSRTKAREVHFAEALYEAGTLASLDAGVMRSCLLQIENKLEPDAPQLRPIVLRPMTTGNWRLVYLLGVMVTDPEDSVVLDNMTVQRDLTAKLDMMADAVTWPAAFATGNADAAEATAEGVWTLDAGLAKGRGLENEHLLQLVMGSRRDETGPLECWYACDEQARSVLFLMRRQAGTYDELVFHLLNEAEPLRAFREILDAAILCQVPAGTEVTLREVDLYDYRKQAKLARRSWISRPKDPPDLPAQPADRDGADDRK